jgi:hypothetical protein
MYARLESPKKVGMIKCFWPEHKVYGLKIDQGIMIDSALLITKYS